MIWRQARRATVEANSRLTAQTGVVLFVLLAAEGVTILGIRALLLPHIFIGLLLVPPLLLKMASTGHRFARYYLGDRAYREAGPPQILLRLAAPVVVLTTVVLFATGIELWLFGLRFGEIWLTAHKLSFLLWFLATAAHVLGHLVDTPRLALAREPRRSGVLTLRLLIMGSLMLGVLLALGSLLWQTPFVPGLTG